jgi:hypothetical protein
MLLPSRVSFLEDPENCPRKYLKIFSTEFIFRQQKILLTIDAIERYISKLGRLELNQVRQIRLLVSLLLSFAFFVSFDIQSQKVAIFTLQILSSFDKFYGTICLHVGERSEFLTQLGYSHWLSRLDFRRNRLPVFY